MRWMVALLVVIAIFAVVVSAQDYAEYARGAGAGRRRNNRGPLMVAAVSGIFGGLLGGVLQARRMKKKFAVERKELLDYIQLQDEIGKQRDKAWQQEYQKVYKAYEQLEKETVERDYEEFKAPDTNQDDMISRKEFDEYVAKYLASFPELAEDDFPQFDEFDLDADGKVSFEEWQNFLAQQKKDEAKKGKSKKDASRGLTHESLYDSVGDYRHRQDGSSLAQAGRGTKGRGRVAP